MPIETRPHALAAMICLSEPQQGLAVYGRVGQPETVRRRVEDALAVHHQQSLAADVVGPVREGLHYIVVHSAPGGRVHFNETRVGVILLP